VRQFGEVSRGTAPRQDSDEVNRLGDQCAWDSDDSFLNKLFHATQGTKSGPGMDRADAAGMAGAPRLEEIERFWAADLANGDAVRS